jgi:hypothetical protein
MVKSKVVFHQTAGVFLKQVTQSLFTRLLGLPMSMSPLECFVRRVGVLALLLFAGATCAAEAQGRAPIRALHVVVKNVALPDIKRIIDQAQEHHFNMMVLGVFNAVRFDSMPLGKEKVPTWSVREFMEVVTYARSKGLDVVPELKLLSHQEHFFAKYRPDLLFNATTYEPRNPEVYVQTYKVLDEIIRLVKPRAIHIGHDEVAGFNAYTEKKWLGRGQVMLPAHLFLEDVKRLHGYLEKKGVETWMWGDMLSSPDEYPELKPKTLHGTKLGYGRELRKKLPKSVVICDWRYGDDLDVFPTSKTFVNEGFRVIGTTFKRFETTEKFSRFASRSGLEGMIATTWFHVQKKNWDDVDEIIRTSGRIFSQDFPDAR